MRKNNSLLVVFLVLFIVISLVLGGYIFYDKVLKEEEETPIVLEEEHKVVSLITENKTLKYVGSCLNDKSVTTKLEIPQITTNKTNAKSLNQKIKSDFADVINEYNKSETDMAIISAKYDYVIQRNVIYIYTEKVFSRGCSSGSTTRKNYFYDIDNDKILSMEEAFNEAGYTLDDLQTTAYKAWDFNYVCKNDEVVAENEDSPWNVTFSTCESNRCGCGLKIVKSNLIPYYYHNCA